MWPLSMRVPQGVWGERNPGLLRNRRTSASTEVAAASSPPCPPEAEVEAMMGEAERVDADEDATHGPDNRGGDL